MKEKIK